MKAKCVLVATNFKECKYTKPYFLVNFSWKLFSYLQFFIFISTSQFNLKA